MKKLLGAVLVVLLCALCSLCHGASAGVRGTAPSNPWTLSKIEISIPTESSISGYLATAASYSLSPIDIVNETKSPENPSEPSAENPSIALVVAELSGESSISHCYTWSAPPTSTEDGSFSLRISGAKISPDVGTSLGSYAEIQVNGRYVGRVSITGYKGAPTERDILVSPPASENKDMNVGIIVRDTRGALLCEASYSYAVLDSSPLASTPGPTLSDSPGVEAPPSWEPTADQPIILLHWVDEGGNYVSVPAAYQGMVNGMHAYWLQVTDPFVVENRLGSVACTVTGQNEGDLFEPDPTVGINFASRLDVPVLITNVTQMRSWILIASILPMPGATAAPDPTDVPRPTSYSTSTSGTSYGYLTTGDSGEAVVSLQNRLRELGYLEHVDGIYNKETEAAVRAFQARNGQWMDGKAGPDTQTALFSGRALPTPEDEQIGAAPLSSFGVTKPNSVLRTSADSASTRIDVLSGGTLVTILSVSNEADGHTWYEVSAGGVTGFLRGDFISQMTTSQYEDNIKDSAFAISEVELYRERSHKRFRVSTENNTPFTIDAFDVVARAYNSYGELIVWHNVGNDTTRRFSRAEITIRPGRNNSMWGSYWEILGWSSAAKIEVAIARYHTMEAGTITISPSDYVWVEGKLK